MEKILLVDYDPNILQTYRQKFSDDGYQVILAKDGKEALKKFEAEHPELIIMEMRLPGMDGIETLTSILGKDRQAAIIINTAFPQYRENFMTWGAEAYLIKHPDSSDVRELQNKVHEVMNKHRTTATPKALVVAPLPPGPSPN